MFGKMKYYYQFIEGAIPGSVVGDALGVSGEFMTREELRENPIADMIGGGAHDQLPGTWPDDTSMTLCTIDSMIETGINYDDQMHLSQTGFGAHPTRRVMRCLMSVAQPSRQ